MKKQQQCQLKVILKDAVKGAKFMDEETFEIAKENNLSLEEAEQLQEVMDETGLDAEEALEISQDL